MHDKQEVVWCLCEKFTRNSPEIHPIFTHWLDISSNNIYHSIQFYGLKMYETASLPSDDALENTKLFILISNLLILFLSTYNYQCHWQNQQYTHKKHTTWKSVWQLCRITYLAQETEENSVLLTYLMIEINKVSSQQIALWKQWKLLHMPIPLEFLYVNITWHQNIDTSNAFELVIAVGCSRSIFTPSHHFSINYYFD